MSVHVSPIREPLIEGHKTYHQITEDLIGPSEKAPNLAWIAALSVSLACLTFGGVAIVWTIWFGIGSWDLNRTIGWGWDITNFVWWIGIGHAGTLISAILLLFRQKWRTGVNRAAEAMTIFAVMCAGLFPALHTGRPWLDFFMFPYPNTRGPLWVNFNSPLLWDLFAISTYFTVSLLFWYTGLVPDFATMRDRSKGIRKKIYNFLSFGWTGSAKHWQRWESLSLVLAGLATPLVLSVHTIVSFDFATSVIPGWHTTIFPPYFVAGAIFSGFAMVLTLMLITRKILKLEQYITIEHIESMNKVILCTGSIVGVAYLTELFVAWYSGYVYEQYAFFNRALGPYWWAYWGMMTCNVITPQLFWSRRIRRSIIWTFALSIVVNIGMWFERFVIIATTLARDYLPSSWSYYSPTWVEIGIFVGTLGLFFSLYLIFTRVAPVVAVAEIKAILKSAGDQYTGAGAVHGHAGHPSPTRKTTGAEELHNELGAGTTIGGPQVGGVPDEDLPGNVSTNPSGDTLLEVEKSDPEMDVDLAGEDDVDANITNESSDGGAFAERDDLKVVEGIGPKIEALLKNEGINTWLKLAQTDSVTLKTILINAGSRFASKDPTTWPAQARMAEEGKWEELKKWQDELDGGRIK